MPRSPRSRRAKVKAVSDKPKRERSLSYTRSPLPPSPGDNPLTSTMDVKDIESAVINCLASDSFVDKIVSKLTAKIRDAVVDALSKSLKEAQARIDELGREVVGLKAELQRVDARASDKEDEVEQYQRRNNLRVFGVPECQGEDSDGVVLELLRTKLGVDFPLERIERSHRVGRPPPTTDEKSTARPRPIIVRFCSYRDRQEVFKKKKCLKGTNITLREDLTARRAGILRKAISLHGHGKVWTVDGRVKWEDAQGRRGVATRLEDFKAR